MTKKEALVQEVLDEFDKRQAADSDAAPVVRRHLSLLYRIVLLSPISYQCHLILHMLQVFPASGEVPYGGSSASTCACASGCPSASASGGASGGPSGGALPSKVIPGPSPLLTLIHCLIKVDKSFLCFTIIHLSF